MNSNINNLFSGKFYIHEAYGLSLVPTLIKAFTSVSYVEKSADDLKKEVVSTAKRSDSSGQVSSNSKSVAIITFNQPVIKYTDYWTGWLGTQTYIQILEQFKNDDSVAGVVLKVDSGGGQVYGTPEFFEYVRDFSAVKPIVVYTNGYLCSGAYYFAAGASWIVAHKRADAIGSIGVYTVIVDFNGILVKYGASIHTLYSNESPDKNKTYRNLLSGEDKDGKEYIKIELDPIAQTFRVDMKSVRPQIKEEAFKGGVWNGEQALEMGLVDEIGTEETAIAKVYELAKAQNSNNNSNSNSTKKSMSTKKSFPNITKTIGVQGDSLTIVKKTMSGRKGVFIEEAQLDALEAHLADSEKAVTTANDKATAAEGKITKIEGAVNAAIKTAGLEKEVEASTTTDAKISLLGTKVDEYGKISGKRTERSKSEGDQFEAENDIVNKNDDHNKFYENA